MHKKSKKERTRLVLILVAIITLLSVLAGSVYKDWKQILENQRLEIELNNKYNSLLENEEKLNSEIAKLSDNEGLINYARENFLLSTEGDIIITLDNK